MAPARILPPPWLTLTSAAYALVWALALVAWQMTGRGTGWIYAGVFGASLPLGVFWLHWMLTAGRNERVLQALSGSLICGPIMRRAPPLSIVPLVGAGPTDGVAASYVSATVGPPSRDRRGRHL